MFCKNCGAKLDENTRFCPSCGAEVITTGQRKTYTAPKPFEKNSIDESQNYHYQKSAFKGKQFSTGTSGSISFGGGKKKKSFLGRIIKTGIIVTIIYIAATALFGHSGIYNVHTGTAIDYQTYEIIQETDTFAVDTPEIFVTFSIQDYDIGTDITAKWISVTQDNYVITSSVITTTEDNQNAYFSLTKPTAGWPVGDYEVQFLDEEGFVTSIMFTVE